MLYFRDRTLWPRELPDYTPFILKNLRVLDRLIGSRLIHIERAIRKIGKAISDIITRKANGEIVVIEIQVMPADMSHWKMIAQYARNHKASLVIWITENFNDKLMAVVQEHNRRPDAPFEVFAVACRVPAVLPLAPYFEVVAWPEGSSSLPKIAPCVGELHPFAELWATLEILHPDEMRRSHQRRFHIRHGTKVLGGWHVAMNIFD